MVFSVIAVCRESIKLKFCPQEMKLSLPWDLEARRGLLHLRSRLARPPAFSACLDSPRSSLLETGHTSVLSSFISKTVFKYVCFLKQS